MLFRSSHAAFLALASGVALAGVLAAACSDDTESSLRGRKGGSSGTTASGDGGYDPNNPNGGGPGPEEVLFRALEPDLQKKCGGACHTDGTYVPAPPTFLAPPDAYKSIKSQPGIVTRDVYQSSFITKGPHAGPALNADAEFEKKVIDWLTAEAVAIQSQALPTTDAITVTNGANDVDLTKVASGGLTGVRLKFDAKLLGGMLSLSNIKLVAGAGTDVHLLKPRFVRVLPQPKEDGTTDVKDPADSFSNLDLTVPAGQETAVPPGSVIFSGNGFVPFDLAADKLRIEAEKLEPGKVQVVEAPKTCKNVNLFATNVLPSMKGGGGVSLNCASCHGAGLAGLNLNSTDNALICNQVLLKINSANIAQSLIITKVTQGPHNGGTVADGTGWTNLFVNNAAAF